MLDGHRRLSLPVVGNHGRLTNSDGPTTPSKRKNLPRRSLAICTLVIVLLLIVISALSSKEALRLRKRAQSRPSLVGILVGDDNGINTRNKDNQTHLVYPSVPSDPSRTKEARQIEALAIMDGIGGDTTRPVLALLGDDREAPAGGADIASRQALLLQKHIESRKGGNRGSYPSGVITTTIKQVFSDGQVKDLTVNAAQRAFLELMSDGLESQDIDVLDVPKEKAWWEVDLNEVDLNTEQADHVLDEFSSHHHDPLQHYTHLGAMSQRGDKSMTAVSPQCRIAVLDVANDIGPSIEARQYDLSHKRVWPFAQQNYGIDGVATLLPEDYQYSIEYWISGGIRASERYTTDLDAADFIFVDYWTYHLAWLAYVHPLGSRNITNPEPYMRLSLAKILQSERFLRSKGSDFAFVHPSPIMANLFNEEIMCEDLASALIMVPERSSLCVWTPDDALQGKSLLLPYLATLDLELDKQLSSKNRSIFIFFRGGCGHPAVKGLFAAGKMMRYELVTYLKTMNHHPKGKIIAECSCDICDNKMPHPTLMDHYRQSQFCPVMPSNAQSSRRLSEIVLAGCIPVFLGPPFHTLPLAQYVNYAQMGIFFNISQPVWVNESSPNHLQNSMIHRIWRVDDPSIEQHFVHVANFEEAVQYLGRISADEIAEKQKAVVSERWKFYYGPVPAHAAGNGKSSQLVDILMDEMCLRAAAVSRKQAS